MRRVIKFSLIFLLVLVLLVVGLIGTVISTPGLHFVINSAARWVPGLDIAGVTGGWRNLTLTGVSYQMPGVKVKAGEFHLAVDIGCLKKSELCLNALTANQIDVAINTQELAPSEPTPETTSEPLTELKAPYPVAIRLLRINNVHVTVDDTAISLEEFRTGAEWRDRGLTLLPTNIKSLLVALPKTPATPVQDQVVAVAVKDKPVTQAAMDAATDSAKQAASDAAEHVVKQVAKPEQAKAEAQKDAQAEAEKAAIEKPLGEVLAELFAKPLLPDLPELRLPLDLTVKRISGEQLRITGDSDIVVNSLLVRAVTKDSALRLHTLEVRSPQGNVSMHGQAT
ncbi:MAG: translocation and assembly module TamB, partial [Enterobacterales bacterium]|nr:translocation and assembly module TamB [Enterobacterales bacterium]